MNTSTPTSDPKVSTAAVAPSAEKVNLLGLSLPKLEQFFLGLGEKKFRATQLMKWVHQLGVADFDGMSNMSKSLRTRLAEVAEIRVPEIVFDKTSTDGTRKWVIRMNGGSSIETVFIPEGNRGTLCVSSQVGCALDCSFCSTGKQGFNRNLSAAEIIGQIWVANRCLGVSNNNKERRITNVVMMGMGEPLLNFDNVVDAMSIMMEDNAYSISKRRLTLSTAGVVPALDKLGEVSDVSLALSLHAPNDALRDQLVPINKKYPIARLLASAQAYMAKLSDKRRITIEYTLIDGVNDLREHAFQLIDLLRDVPVKINLIPFNPFPHSGYKKPSAKRVQQFQHWLNQAGYVTTVRTTRGDDIDAACGQLVGQVEDRTRRSQKYIKLVEEHVA